MSDKYLRIPYFCAFEPSKQTPGEWLAVIWQYGGAVDGCHQPCKVVEIFAHNNDARLRFLVEECYPGMDYAPYPNQCPQPCKSCDFALPARVDRMGVVYYPRLPNDECDACRDYRENPPATADWGEDSPFYAGQR